MIDQLQSLIAPLGVSIWNLIVALLILIIGYLVARIVGSITRSLLKRTNLDNRLADTLSEPDKRRELNIEDGVAKVVFWLIMLFVLVAFFQRLGMTGIASPISAFLERVTTEFLPRLVAAGIILFIAWLVALALKFLVQKGASLLQLDERLSRHAALEDEERVSFGDSLATAVYWFVFLLFLPSVLNTLGLQEIARPINDVFDAIISYLPNILGAIVVAAIGWFIARVVREIVTNLLIAIGADKLGERVGLSAERSLSSLIGMLVYVFIWLVVLVSALDVLDIAAITIPATQMLSTIINVIPNLIGAALILVIAYYVGRLISNLIRDLISGVGFDALPEKIGLQWSVTTSPSQWVAYLILFAIMLFATVSALEMLGTNALVGMLNLFTVFFWKVVLAVVIFAIGLYFANFSYRLVLASGTNQANFLARMAQIAIIIFAAAISLREIGVANDIINIAFGVTLLAIGLAVALSLGLGTTKISEREVDGFISKLREPKEESEE
jgi:hypothetical protein